ncbi:hypothetical protein HK096_002921, partial [Nowakowskiella sp. JEL0078]
MLGQNGNPRKRKWFEDEEYLEHSMELLNVNSWMGQNARFRSIEGLNSQEIAFARSLAIIHLSETLFINIEFTHNQFEDVSWISKEERDSKIFQTPNLIDSCDLYTIRNSATVPSSPVLNRKMQSSFISLINNNVHAKKNNNLKFTLRTLQKQNESQFSEILVPGDLKIPMPIYQISRCILYHATNLKPEIPFEKMTNSARYHPESPKSIRLQQIKHNIQIKGVEVAVNLVGPFDVNDMMIILKEYLHDKFKIFPDDLHPILKGILALNSNSPIKPPEGCSTPLPTLQITRLLRDTILLLPRSNRELLRFILRLLVHLATISIRTSVSFRRISTPPQENLWFQTIHSLARNFGPSLIPASDPPPSSTPRRGGSGATSGWPALCLELLLHTQAPLVHQRAVESGQMNVTSSFSFASTPFGFCGTADPDAVLRAAADTEGVSPLWWLGPAVMEVVAAGVNAATPRRNTFGTLVRKCAKALAGGLKSSSKKLAFGKRLEDAKEIEVEVM